VPGISKEAPEYLHKHADHHTEDNHGSDGKVKAEILSFHPYVARQVAEPVQLVVKEINQQADYDDHNTPDDNVFASFRIHEE